MTCTHYYIRIDTNKKLLCCTGSSSQYFEMTYMEKESKTEWIYVYVWASQLTLVVKNPSANVGDTRDMG